jgi:hypothetical protein
MTVQPLPGSVQRALRAVPVKGRRLSGDPAERQEPGKQAVGLSAR